MLSELEAIPKIINYLQRQVGNQALGDTQAARFMEAAGAEHTVRIPHPCQSNVYKDNLSHMKIVTII